MKFTFKDFQIVNTWVYIIGLAFGSKVFQKFKEEEKKKLDQNRSDATK